METNRFDHNDAATIPASGLIYALQTKPPSLLEFAPDGTHVKTLIANLGGRPDGVQVDATRGLIYFSMMGKPRLLDAREDFSAADGSIECCNLDGSNRRLLVGNGDIVTAKQVVLDAEGGLLYWCDREGMRVMRSRTDGGEVTTLVRTGLIPEDQKDETLHCVGVAIDRESGHI
jgi:sugar lactone lactonase YvrE